MFARCRKSHKYVLSGAIEKEILLQSDSYCSIPNVKIERKFCRRLFTSSFKSEIKTFHVVVRVKETAQKCNKECGAGAKLFFCLLNLLLFWCSRCIVKSFFNFLAFFTWIREGRGRGWWRGRGGRGWGEKSVEIPNYRGRRGWREKSVEVE